MISYATAKKGASLPVQTVRSEYTFLISDDFIGGYITYRVTKHINIVANAFDSSRQG
jgi:hypothetical protein